MSCRRRWAALSLVAVCGFASNVRAKEVDLHVEGGTLLGVNISEMSPRPTLGGDVSWWWAPHPVFHLGVETGLDMTVLPYGCSDTGLSIGERGHSGCGDALTEHFTALPRLSFGSRLLVTPATALVASLGATFIMPTLEDNVVFRPFPTFGVAFETSLGRGGHLGLRAGVSYIHSVYGTRSGGFLALTWK